MSLIEVVVEGTLKPDGTLELDEKPNLPPGRVVVALRQEVALPKDDPFWQRMQAMWDIPESLRTGGDGGSQTLAEVRRMREEWAGHQQAIERLQEECRAARPAAGESKQ
jgi:hypothetical protein